MSPNHLKSGKSTVYCAQIWGETRHGGADRGHTGAESGQFGSPDNPDGADTAGAQEGPGVTNTDDGLERTPPPEARRPPLPHRAREGLPGKGAERGGDPEANADGHDAGAGEEAQRDRRGTGDAPPLRRRVLAEARAHRRGRAAHQGPGRRDHAGGGEPGRREAEGRPGSCGAQRVFARRDPGASPDHDELEVRPGPCDRGEYDPGPNEFQVCPDRAERSPLPRAGEALRRDRGGSSACTLPRLKYRRYGIGVSGICTSSRSSSWGTGISTRWCTFPCAGSSSRTTRGSK